MSYCVHGCSSVNITCYKEASILLKFPLHSMYENSNALSFWYRKYPLLSVWNEKTVADSANVSDVNRILNDYSKPVNGLPFLNCSKFEFPNSLSSK